MSDMEMAEFTKVSDDQAGARAAWEPLTFEKTSAKDAEAGEANSEPDFATYS